MSVALLSVYDYHRELAALKRQRPWYYDGEGLPACKIYHVSFDDDACGQRELEIHIERRHEGN